MQEYREKAAATPLQTEPAATIKNCPMYMSLAQQYGLADEMEIGESSQSVQTIKQEYQAYITAPLVKNVNILKFWEVGGTINGT
jgi:hypothetical protein